MSGEDLFSAIRARPVMEVARQLGIRDGRGGKGLECCLCNAVTRHTKSRDKRAAVGVNESKGLWHCFQCEVGGDGMDLVAAHLGGSRYGDSDESDKAAAREWVCNWLGIESKAGKGGGKRKRKAVKRAPVPKILREERPPAVDDRQYPPHAEVLKLWELGRRIDDDQEAANWLREVRGIDPTAVADLDLARVLPVGVRVGKAWAFASHRIIVPLYDCAGVMRSLIFRRCFESKREGSKKSMSARGKREGLVMACGRARRLMELGTHPSEWPSLGGAPWDDIPQPRRQRLDVVVAEGEMDFLCWATEWPAGQDFPPMVMATPGGAWPKSVADRIPRGARVIAATDIDEAGSKYALKIHESFGARNVDVVRWGAAA